MSDTNDKKSQFTPEEQAALLSISKSTQKRMSEMASGYLSAKLPEGTPGTIHLLIFGTAVQSLMAQLVVHGKVRVCSPN